MPRPVRPSVCPSVPPGPARRASFRPGHQSCADCGSDAHGRRSAAIGGRHIVSPRDNLLVSVSTDGSLGSVCCTAGLAEVGFLGLIFV